MTREQQIAVLTAHKKNIETSLTFEDFKARQIAYIDFLIEEFNIELKKDELILGWIVRPEIMTND